MTTGTISSRTGRHRRLTLVLAAAMAVGAAVGAQASPAGAGTAEDPALRSLCGELADMPPEGAEITTDPPQGAPLQAGQTVTVTLRWDPRAFAGPDLQRAAHCVVALDGRLRLDLSGSEAPSPNDGVYRGSFVVPAELAPGDCLCVLGVASGERPDGGGTRLGGNPCLTVTKPAPPTPPPVPPTTPVTTPPRPPAAVLPTTETAPPPALVIPAGTVPLPLTELPRTGPSDVRFLLALAGVALVFGGGGVAARRQ
jgi:LPXTG-motif cell wall-anchored protein